MGASNFPQISCESLNLRSSAPYWYLQQRLDLPDGGVGGMVFIRSSSRFPDWLLTK